MGEDRSSDVWEDLTPVAKLPRYEELPMRVAVLEKAVDRIAEDRDEHRDGLKSLRRTLISVGVVLFLAAAGMFVQMGRYMERIDKISTTVQQLEVQGQRAEGP